MGKPFGGGILRLSQFCVGPVGQSRVFLLLKGLVNLDFRKFRLIDFRT